MANTKPETISQLANKIIKGESKLSDVPAFRRKPVENLMKIAKPEAIASMAAKDDGNVKPRQADSSRFSREGAAFGRVRNVRSF
jgi:hypothetical protein